MRCLLTNDLIYILLGNKRRFMFELIKSNLSVISDGCVLLITIYTFYLKFWCKKVKFIQYAPSFKMFKGDSLAVTIENCTLSPICYDAVYIIYGNKYKLLLEKYDTPQIMEPFKTSVVKMEPFSFIEGITFSQLNKIPEKYLEIHTSKSTIYAKLYKKLRIYNEKIRPLNTVTVVRRYYNNHLVFPNTRYVLLYKEDQRVETILIDDNGFMSKTIGWFNAIPKECLNDINKVQEIFNPFFLPLEIVFQIKDLKR